MRDPYAAPQSSIEISEGIVDALRSTRPWVLFIAILLGLCTLAMFGGGAVIALGGVLGVAAGGSEGVVLLGMAVFYMLLGCVYVLPAWWLVSYFRAIGGVVAFQDTEHVERALLAQRNFWRGVGVLTILAMLVYFAAVGIFMFAAILVPSL